MKIIFGKKHLLREGMNHVTFPINYVMLYNLNLTTFTHE